MTDFRRVTDAISVSPQIAPQDVATAAAQGFKLVINNRPDDEQAGQPSSAQIEAAARAAGLDYVHIPFAGRPGPGEVAAVHEAVQSAKGPVLLFCRSGTRSITAWSMGEAQAGRDRDELIGLGAEAGYDLSNSL